MAIVVDLPVRLGLNHIHLLLKLAFCLIMLCYNLWNSTHLPVSSLVLTLRSGCEGQVKQLSVRFEIMIPQEELMRAGAVVKERRPVDAQWCDVSFSNCGKGLLLFPPPSALVLWCLSQQITFCPPLEMESPLVCHSFMVLWFSSSCVCVLAPDIYIIQLL